MEAGSLPIVQEPLVPTKGASLAPEVDALLKEISLLGLLSEGDLDSRTLGAITDLSTADALEVLQQFRDSPNLDTAASKSSLLCELAKNQKLKSRPVRGLMETRPGPDEAKLKEILERTKYSHDVSTGQRKYGGPPPDWTDPQPGPGHEIYCGHLPKEMFEDELIPLFEQYGKIWDLRLMIDPVSGRNRGYCFVTYCDKTEAQAAIDGLNNFEVKPGRTLKVNQSAANVRLFIGNIPKNKSQEEIKEEFGMHTEGVVEVIVYSSPDDDRKKNRGFAFIDYDSHKSASNAKRLLTGGRVRVWGVEVFVDWAEPQEEPDDDTMSKVKVLYVRNLKANVTEEQLKEIFEPYGAVERVKRVKSYGFVHFEERESAIKAMDALNGTKIGELEVEISLAKPSSRNNKKERRRLQQMYSGGRYMNGAGYADPWGYAGYRAGPGKGYDYYGGGYDGYAYDADYYYGGGFDYGYYGGGASYLPRGYPAAGGRRGMLVRDEGNEYYASSGGWGGGSSRGYRGGRRGGLPSSRR